MATKKKDQTLRLGEEHIAKFASHAKEMGMSKNALLEYWIDNHTNTHVRVTSDKASHSNSSEFFLGEDHSPEVRVTLKGVEAEKAILSGLVLHFKDKSKMLLLDSWLWAITKTANGSQKVISKCVYIPPALARGFVESGLDLPSLSEIIDNIAFYAELKKACSFTGKDIEDICPAYLALYVKPGQKFRFLNEALEQPTAAVEAIEEEAPALVEEVPLAPIDESTKEQNIEPEIVEAVEPEPTVEVVAPAKVDDPKPPITKKEFQAKYVFSPRGKNSYGMVCRTARENGWLANDGQRWFCNQKATRWSTDKAAVSQLELALA